MRVCHVLPEHVPAIAALEAACFSDPWPEELIARLRGTFIAALEEDGTLLGYLSLSHVLDEGSIDSVAVAPAHRRRGVASALIEYALRRARAMRLAFVTLEVRASNLAAIALYRRHGFAEVGRRRAYYEKPREDAILMTFFLSERHKPC